MSFLALDIGNTRLKWGLYRDAHPGAALLAHGAVFLENIDTLHEREWATLRPAPTAVLGSVVAGEQVRRRVEEQLEALGLEPSWLASSAEAAGVRNGYEHPTRLGTDRWLALIGARARLLVEPVPAAAVVVMVGTAVTVDALDTEGRFLGGLILPGFGLMLKALESGTAGLRVPTGDVHPFPTNTSDALMSGGAYGIAGAVERMHAHLQARSGAPVRVLMSGGAAPKLAPITRLPVEQIEHLVFDGVLMLAAERAAPVPLPATPVATVLAGWVGRAGVG